MQNKYGASQSQKQAATERSGVGKGVEVQKVTEGRTWIQESKLKGIKEIFEGRALEGGRRGCNDKQWERGNMGRKRKNLHVIY